MIQLCPSCGHSLSKPICDGITSCLNCHRVFDTCRFNRLLSAGWLVRRRHYDEVDDLVRQGYTAEDAELVIRFVVENQCSPEEFAAELKRIGVSNLYTVAC